MVEAKFVIHALEQQHESIRKLIAQTLDAPDNDHREMAFFELRKLLAVHETVEEMFVHPLARQERKVGAGVVDGRQAEESEIKQHLQRIEGIDMGSAEFVARITELRSVVQDHTEHEEKEEFRGLRGYFFDAEELR
jgi:hypothetical protein